MFLDGYESLILQGTLTTLQLGLSSLFGSMFIGMIGASAKLSENKGARNCATVYTTLIRSIPDLVLMMLIFFSLQIWLNQLTDRLAVSQININPFMAGVLTLSFIYGAYFTETFRGAIQSIPKGQLEAAASFGMTKATILRRITLPLMMRFALPGIANNWLVLIKATALVSLIGLSDLLKATSDAGKATQQFFYYSFVAAFIYLAITTVSNIILALLERHYSIGVKRNAS